MKFLRYMKRFLEVDMLERRILIKGIWLSGIMRFMTKFLPFRYYQEFMHPEIKESVANEDIAYITGKINKSLRRVGRIVPWSLSCMVKAMIARKLCAEFGIQGKLILSLAYGEEKDLRAHAFFRTDADLTGSKTGTGKQVFMFYL
jgi:hypothetical protein